MKRWHFLTLLALSACHLGRGMDMAPGKPYMVAPDSRPPSEIDPALHVELPPIVDGGAAFEQLHLEQLMGRPTRPKALKKLSATPPLVNDHPGGLDRPDKEKTHEETTTRR